MIIYEVYYILDKAANGPEAIILPGTCKYINMYYGVLY